MGTVAGPVYKEGQEIKQGRSEALTQMVQGMMLKPVGENCMVGALGYSRACANGKPSLFLPMWQSLGVNLFQAGVSLPSLLPFSLS